MTYELISLREALITLENMKDKQAIGNFGKFHNKIIKNCQDALKKLKCVNRVIAVRVSEKQPDEKGHYLALSNRMMWSVDYYDPDTGWKNNDVYAWSYLPTLEKKSFKNV